ncbi:divalent-cation tolerance protein CutA [Methylocaldum sp.]|uniref:divalent-cation tolerance protein CutA n=1 Tax=Methylocaldum sp. TaxID=1969727 RepID=UPI002D36E5EC|nr:divalent-cation tolerance protein CutA [Methylocaldum sp.]HYE34151.1 divalent-cation tolerance protein CutA [Methylocaldum sp.]
MSTEHCLVLCTCPDAETAEKLATALVAERLATCAGIVPGLTSIYPWEGKIETAQEHLLLIKTETASFEALEASIREKHPYELPEIIAVPILHGSTAYLEWISKWLHPKT